MPATTPRRLDRLACAIARHALASAAAAPFALAVLLGGAAEAAVPGAPPAAGAEVARVDPLQRANRAAFALALGLDRALVRPAAVAWRHAAPRPVRAGLVRFGANLGEPAVALNDGLQGRPRAAARAALRFVVNSTVGIGGLFDPAAAAGLPHHDNDFGLTLARRGVGSGPYLFVPVAGPTTLRDATARLLDLAANPLTWVGGAGSTALGAGTGVANGLERRGAADGDLRALRASSVDTYAAVRSYYLQAREAQVRGGVVRVEALPDFGPDEDAMGSAAAPAPVAGGAQ